MAACDSDSSGAAEPQPPVAVGVDGCGFGWIAVYGTRASMHYRLFRAFGELADAFGAARAVCVDIPIGLPSPARPTRPCDQLARRVLGARHVTVFPAPSRAACRELDMARARERNQEDTGRSLSEQALAIRQKIDEVDRCLQANPGVRLRVREVHPEVCFWGLNGRAALLEPKSGAAGIEARLRLLRPYLPDADRLVQEVHGRERRTHVRSDDVVDAMAAFVVASADPAHLRTLPPVSSLDDAGLPMEMVYLDADDPRL